MSKKLGVVFFMLVLIAVGWVAANKFTEFKDFQISIAFGFPKETEIEMHVVASMGMTALEAPTFNPKVGGVDWDAWVANHFDLRDASGKQVHIDFMKGSDVVNTKKLPGVPEGFLFARVKQGGKYTFDYKPKLADPMKLRYAFTAPTADKPVEWCKFEKA
ncbi:MAG: hypothetical protein HY287_14535 [Planctomycetes bacterium]|nr:hypothetical protein [Planctomycetota bacterium]MBI3835540.1 hypothetical protein [Planctomycetota bacterium]